MYKKQLTVAWDERGIMKIIITVVLLALFMSVAYAQYDDDESDGEYLGKYNSNPYDSDSTSNPYGPYGSKYSSESINNPYGQYGSPYSSKSANNPYAIDTPKLYSQDGEYLGKVSSNPYDPESISNPYGKYGSSYSPDSVNNPYGRYGSKYSSQSANNHYTTNAPKIYDSNKK